MQRGFFVAAAVATLLLGACASGATHGAGSVSSTSVSSANGGPTSSARSTGASSTRPGSAVTAPTVTPATVATVAAPQVYEPALPLPIQEAAAAVVGDRLYVVGGYDTARNSSARVFVFDGSRWSTGPSLPIAVNHPGAAVIGSDVYVAGGFTPGGATAQAFVLRSGTSRWDPITPMRRARGALALVALAGRLYAIGGRDGSVQIAVPEVYDPATAAWHDTAPMPAPRNHVAGYVDGAMVCVAGGRTPDTSAAVDCLDPAAGVWMERARLPIGTSGATAGVLGGVTVVAGGEPASETHVITVIQSRSNGTWTDTPMLVPRHGAAYARYHGRLWACGGATAPGFQAVSTCTSIGG